MKKPNIQAYVCTYTATLWVKSYKEILWTMLLCCGGKTKYRVGEYVCPVVKTVKWVGDTARSTVQLPNKWMEDIIMGKHQPEHMFLFSIICPIRFRWNTSGALTCRWQGMVDTLAICPARIEATGLREQQRGELTPSHTTSRCPH